MVWTNPTDRPICVNADKSQIVQCDSTDAAYQLVGPGGQIPDDVAAQYPNLPTAPEEKDAGPPPADKQRDAPDDKGVAPHQDEGPAVPRRR